MPCHHRASPESWYVVTSDVTKGNTEIEMVTALYSTHVRTHAHRHIQLRTHTTFINPHKCVHPYLFMGGVFSFILFRIIVVFSLLLNKHIIRLITYITLTFTLVSSRGMITFTYLSRHCIVTYKHVNRYVIF